MLAWRSARAPKMFLGVDGRDLIIQRTVHQSWRIVADNWVALIEIGNLNIGLRLAPRHPLFLESINENHQEILYYRRQQWLRPRYRTPH
jgi:hypothetical protein